MSDFFLRLYISFSCSNMRLFALTPAPRKLSLIAVNAARRFSLTTMNYDEAVRTLNCLQNANIKKTRDAGNLALMQSFLDRASITQEDLKKLNVIHISGTKGKGSTCAFIESILRHHGYKTGFFSSPHLVEVRERLRINGEPISKSKFAKYFEELHKRFAESANSHEIPFPSYFYFLTTMAFHVFLAHRVDVAIMEVGIGGAFDCTNVIEFPSVCGVAALGYDHTSLLGDTIESIAWHKSGIFKPGAPAFTAPQIYSAMQVLSQTALEAEIMLQTCPDLSYYPTENGQRVQLGLAGDHQETNASLALQISESWMRRNRRNKKSDERYVYMSEVEAFPSSAEPFLLTVTHLRALKSCSWKGRAQIMKFRNLTFYLDGAHTVESMRCCADWFRDAASREEEELGRECVRILAFNVTKNRDAGALFDVLKSCKIVDAVFTPNIATLAPSDCADQTNLTLPVEQQLLRAMDNREAWMKAREATQDDGDVNAKNKLSSAVFPSIADAVNWFAKERDETLSQLTSGLTSTENTGVPGVPMTKHLQILVTGSVHLVGGYLRILDPDMNS